MSTAISPEQRKLKIQIGVCQRMLKEVNSYEKEVRENEGILKKMRDENRWAFCTELCAADLR